MRSLPLPARLTAILALWLMSASSALAQCAMCKEAVDGDKALGGGVADGISYSILFMLSLPVLIIGGFSLAVWRSYRKEANAPPEGP